MKTVKGTQMLTDKAELVEEDMVAPEIGGTNLSKNVRYL